MCIISYNVTVGQTNYSSWSSKYLTNKHNNNWNSEVLHVFMHDAQSYYDMGVAMVDCVIVIVYTLPYLGSLLKHS